MQTINRPLIPTTQPGEVITTKPEVIEKVNDIVNEFTHEQLMRCLYFLYDAFHRAAVDFFLVKDTAKNALSKHMLDTKIDVGVRRLEWSNDNKDMLFPFFEQERVNIIKQDDFRLDCTYQDIPFTIHIYDDNPCIKYLVPIVYEYEGFLVPNQFDVFEKEYDDNS